MNCRITCNNSCVVDHREYVKLQYGRKIAQDTCMLATMRTPDWFQSASGFAGRNNPNPCTVTTNSGSSSLKMYPYSVYSGTHRYAKSSGPTCARHRCFSGSSAQMCQISPVSLDLQRVLLNPRGFDSAHTFCRVSLTQPTSLSQHPNVYSSSLPIGSISGGFSNQVNHPVHRHHQHQPLAPSSTGLPDHTLFGTQQFLSGFGVQQPYANPASHRTLMVSPDLLQHY